MRLLVSVSDAFEAHAALEGGADIIDAKDPAAGPLGPVTPDVLRDIRRVVGGDRLLTAALGDADSEQAVASRAVAMTAMGASLVKIGFAGTSDPSRVLSLLRAATAATPGVIAVAYADATWAESLSPDGVLDAAAQARAHGVLIDTADKGGPALLDLVSRDALGAWIRRAHDARLTVAVAGRLNAGDLVIVGDLGADVAGVRGAACDGGREGRVSAVLVRQLRSRIALIAAVRDVRPVPSPVS